MAELLEDDDDALGLDEPDDDDADDEDRYAPPPPRRVGRPAARPRPPVVSDGSRSPWERPRDGFTSFMADRANEMSATREGKFVKGDRNIG